MGRARRVHGRTRSRRLHRPRRATWERGEEVPADRRCRERAGDRGRARGRSLGADGTASHHIGRALADPAPHRALGLGDLIYFLLLLALLRVAGLVAVAGRILLTRAAPVAGRVEAR